LESFVSFRSWLISRWIISFLNTINCTSPISNVLVSNIVLCSRSKDFLKSFSLHKPAY
jgi:hypothetical protein